MSTALSLATDGNAIPASPAGEADDAAGRCLICEKSEGTPFSHIYRPDRTITLCSPRCARLFLQRTQTASAWTTTPC